MKTIALKALGIIIAMLPLSVGAQSNIKSAFNAIIKCNEAHITSSHTLDRDITTDIKTGQSDIYSFELPYDKYKLVKNAVEAIEKDSKSAYSLNSGKANRNDRSINLAIGDGSGDGVRINPTDHEYIYALFLPDEKEDIAGKYRYAYGICYKKDHGKITGKLVVTFATTLKYRQLVEEERQNKRFRTFSSKISSTSSPSEQQTWFDILMSYFQSMSSANQQTRIALATKAYKLTANVQNYPHVTGAEKSAVREILKAMISDPKYSETILNKLLQQCLTNLK